jgi:replicative DNA helicase
MNQMNQQFQLPSNIEAEQALLGAILVNNIAFAKIPPTFEAKHFFEPVHSNIFEAMLKGKAANKGMNPVTVRSFMSPQYASAMVGTMTVSQYLARLASEAVNIMNVPDFADAVTDYFHRRQSIIIGEDAQAAGSSAQDELQFLDQVKECRERLTAIITSIEARNEPQETFRDAVDHTTTSTADAMGGRTVIGIDPGIPELVGLTGPWQKGNLIIIGGDVKQGKSALAWQTFFNIAENHPVAGNSGEMPRSQVIMREKARRTGISAKRQKVGAVSDHEMQKLVSADADMKRLKHIDIDCRQLTLSQIDDKIERLVGDFGIEVFYVDHILKLAWTGRMDEAEDFKKANRATSTLKNMAMKHNIAVVAVTHLNKTDEYRAPPGKTYRERLNSALRRRPTSKNLLGNIDKDADSAVVTFQARPLITAMEPEVGTEDYLLWENAMNEVSGKAELILVLSRENEFPRRQEIRWHGSTTSYGPDFNEVYNSRGMF